MRSNEPAPPPWAGTDRGAVSGRWDGAVASFRGIPFGAPPVGPLRWRPPAPAEAWDGVRPAEQFGPAPLQSRPPTDSVMYVTNFAERREVPVSEDCLYLNVWTPEPGRTARLPVMVWVHGGGNRFGHGSQSIHDGAALAGRGLVVVTLNHRLGALGFLAHPELAAEDELGASGNYGLMDILAVLRWVQRNIEQFGGDPDAVTLAGNSAGAAHITHLMAAESARGLFRACIGQSAAGAFRAEGPMPDAAAAHEQGERYVAALPRTGIANLRRLAGMEFLGGHFGPVVDGRVLVRDTQAVYQAGEQARVPLLTGTNTDEGAIYTLASEQQAMRQRAARTSDHAAFVAAYPLDPAGSGASARLWVGETRFVYPVWRWANAHAAAGLPTWLYRFDQRPPLPPQVVTPPDGRPGYGVYHTAELPYVFDNLHQRPWNWTADDADLAAAMAESWARFVVTLDPNTPRIPPWKRFDGTSSGEVMIFSSTPHPGRIDRLGALNLLAGLPRPL